MPKLYFRYGSMNSSKTANLLMVAHNYTSQNKKVLLIKPAIDTRFGNNIIKSRVGVEKDVDILLDYSDYNIKDINNDLLKTIDAILVDEAQFLSSKQVDRLRNISLSVPVLCYGLRTDYLSHLFEGSKRLMEIADTIEEIKNTCTFCDKKAIINLQYDLNKKIIKEGSSNLIILGAEEKYLPSCYKCWITRTYI